VARFNPYKLRHSYATLMRRGGADIADVQVMMGHRSPKTTQRCAMVIPEKLVGAMRGFQAEWSKARGRVAWQRPQQMEKKASSET
jgi:site-specific recombinase XerD